MKKKSNYNSVDSSKTFEKGQPVVAQSTHEARDFELLLSRQKYSRS